MAGLLLQDGLLQRCLKFAQFFLQELAVLRIFRLRQDLLQGQCVGFGEGLVGGDFAGLLALLHPDVEFRQDLGADGVRILRGAEKVASSAAAYHRYAKGFDFEIVELGEGFAVVAIEGGMPVSLLLVISEGDTIVAMETREIG